MRQFSYSRPADEKSAIEEVSHRKTTQFLAGGTLLIDLMKLDVARPERLVDINKLPFAEVKTHGGGVFIGTLVRNSDLANNQLIRQRYPVLSQAILSGASAQIRNVATTGGNILQRTRCPYFRDTTMACNKREPGSGCPAIDGYSRMHAIFGGSDDCVAVHPSDMCIALLALDAIVHTSGDDGERKIPFEEFHLVPGRTPQYETVLRPGELIVGVELPPSKFAAHAHYLKVRDRNSFSFALVSVAACLQLDGKTIGDARITLGGVATKPWRLRDCEKALIGKSVGKETFAAAASAGIKSAKPLKYNKFKVELTRRSIARALEIAAAGGVS